MKLLFLDNSTKLESVHDLKTRARGGMVSSLFTLTDLLSEMGHEVSVMADIQKGGTTEEGTHWLHWYYLEKPILLKGDFDFLICNRGVGDGYPEIKAKRRILWTHDLPHSGFIPDPRIMGAFSATVFMSDYAERVWRCYYHDIGRSYTIPNGVDRSLFYPREKDLNYLIYASAPNRGLKRLPLIFESIRSQVSGKIYMRAFSNMALMHPNEIDDGDNGNGDGFELAYKAVRNSEIDLRDPVPQSVLAEELGTAGLMIMPTDYPEICSNIVLQSLASGTPVVTTGRLGSAREWIKGGRNGRLTDWHPVDYMVYHLEIVRNAIEILNDQGLHRKMVDKAANTKILTWEEVAHKWNNMLRRLS